MLIDLNELVTKYDLDISGVFHVGAHLGEEAPEYARLQVPVWWVEANPAVLRKLQRAIQRYPYQYLIHALVTDIDGADQNFNVTNYDGMSSSVFDFGTHPKYSPDTVFVDHLTLTTSTVDTLVEDHGVVANLFVLDIQGAELLALRGAQKFLETVDYLYTEVSTGPIYRGGAQMKEIDRFLTGFERVETDLGMHGGKHGDAFYVRTHGSNV